MESIHLGNMLTKLGWTTQIVKYYGYNHEWADLLFRLCKSTRKFYKKHRKELTNMDKQIHGDNSDIIGLLKFYEIDKTPHLGDKYALKLNMSTSYHNMFVSKMTDKKFSKLKKLSI